MATEKPRRATGSRTFIDVIHRYGRNPTDGQIVDDIESVRTGYTRFVRCYVSPLPDDKRKHWIPGRATVSKNGLEWNGSSRRWNRILLLSNEWTLNVRRATRLDRVYRTFWVIECSKESVTHSLAVPRADVKLCVASISGELL
jgi:hypothetical protein